MFLRLKDRFRPIAHDNYYKLFDNYTASEYLLNSEQYNLLLNIDGTKTLEQLSNNFNKNNRLALKEFFEELNKIQALEKFPFINRRKFPNNLPRPYLESILWDITSFCNSTCKHCYVSDFSQESKGKDLSLREIYTVIDEMASMNVKEVALTGGEPLVRKDIKKIISAILHSNVRLSAIFTNGIAVTQEFIDFLRKIVPYQKDKFCIRISLDGMTPKSNAVIRGDKMNSVEVFRKMVKAIKEFVDAGFFVSVGTCVHRFNVKEILKMYSFMKALGVSRWRLAVPKPIGRFKQTQNNIMAEWTDILESYRQLIDEHLDEVEIKNNEIIAPIRIAIEQVFGTEIMVQTLNTFKEDDFVCFYHKNHCSLKANGDVISCGYFDDMIGGNIRNGGLKKAWENTAKQKIKSVRVSEVRGCRGCKFLKWCGTGCRAVARMTNESIYSKDPYACFQFPFFVKIVIPLLKKHGFTLRVSKKCSEFSIIHTNGNKY
jgi:radical SAM protein with 4Fe4S-binding SPASM domain